MTGPRVGWVLGFGSLVHPDDPLVRRLAIAGLAIPGSVAGMRRTWTAGLVNAAPEHDAKHHLDPDGTRPDLVVAALSADVLPGADRRAVPGAGSRGVPAAGRGAVPGAGRRGVPRADRQAVPGASRRAGDGGDGDGRRIAPLNVLALPVDADGLRRADARERGYDRIDVSHRFAADRCDGEGPPLLDGPAWIYTATERSRDDVARAAVGGRAVVSRAYVALVEAAFRARGPVAWDAYRASTDAPPHPARELLLHRPGVLPGE